VKHRIAAVFVLCVAVGLFSTVKVHDLVARSHMKEAELQAATTLRLAVSALDGHLKRYEALPALTADDEIIEVLIRDPGNEALRLEANRYLKSVNALLKSSDIYIMTLDGSTIAASNYDRPISFIGENFSYRPYFQQAARG
jgi:two-component system C4-dicarboxylate transport sensor histidine kinase DctB